MLTLEKKRSECSRMVELTSTLTLTTPDNALLQDKKVKNIRKPTNPFFEKTYIYITLSEKFYDICRLFTLSLLFVGVYVYKRVIRCIKVCAKCVSKCAFLVKTLVRLWKCLRIEFNRCFWRLSGGAYEV